MMQSDFARSDGTTVERRASANTPTRRNAPVACRGYEAGTRPNTTTTAAAPSGSGATRTPPD